MIDDNLLFFYIMTQTTDSRLAYNKVECLINYWNKVCANAA